MDQAFQVRIRLLMVPFVLIFLNTGMRPMLSWVCVTHSSSTSQVWLSFSP